MCINSDGSKMPDNFYVAYAVMIPEFARQEIKSKDYYTFVHHDQLCLAIKLDAKKPKRSIFNIFRGK